MKKSGQTHTLFHSWGASKPLTDAYGQPPSSNTAQLGVGGIADPAAGLDLCDEGEDDELIHALAMSEMESKVSQQRASPTAFGIQNDSNARSQTDFPMPKQDLPGFSNFSGRMLTYPTNYPVRDYQLNIVQSAIYKNTLVCLPTGLGKTFIAAVVMYNYFMWYPSGKIVFMAPTKPLVAQQIEACYNIMGIPQTDTAEMTGAMSPVERVKAWQTKRLFFLTPQIVMNDLSRGALPADQIKCLVVDEAHKAQGNHAYCQVVREILKYSKNFRVLALSATPGSDIKSVQQVITNLCITNIELRTEDSLDIKQYSHERQVDKIVVKLDEAVLAVKQKYMRILKMVVERLIRMRVIYNRDPDSLSKFILLKNRDAFRQNPPESLPKSQFGIVEGDFALCISLYHGYDLLQLHGLKPLYSFLEGLASGEKGFSRSRHELLRNADFCAILDELKAKFYPSNMSMSSISTQSESGKPFITGHPKLEKLQEIVLEHHQKYLEEYGNSNTRIMIFSQYRDSVMEITDMLNQHQPLVKVMNFIGQSSTGKSSKGFTQKEQLKVMRQFREGGYNTLVSTCVGEEGLDIGDVDLIICFDAHKSPIRLVQRMGRTGRKRKGRIVMLVTEGKEEMTYKKSLYSKKCIHNAILNSQRSLQFYPNYPQMIPEGHRPALFKTYITIAKSFQSKCSIKQMQNRPAISSNSGGLGHKCGQDGLLSKDEWDDYMEKYYVPEASIPIVEKPIITCLTSTDEKAFVSDDRPVLSLSEWLPWQNVRQETVHVSHSVRTAHLVEIMEFIDLQSTLGEDAGGIAYGVEMSAYLEEEENLLKSEGTNIKSNGILNFLAADKENKDALEKIRRRRIKHASLPQFSSPEEDLDTDEELPEFGVLCRKKNKTMSHQFKTDAALKLEGEDTSLGLPNKTSKTRREGCFGHLIGLDTEADSNRKDMCLTSLGNPKRKNTDKQGCLVDDVGKTSTDSDGHQNALRGETNSTCDIGTTVTDEPVFHAPLSHVAVERAKLGNEQLAVVTKSAGVCGVGVKQALMTSVSGSVKKDRNSKKKCSVQTSLFCDDSDEFEVDSGGKWPTSAVTMCREKGAMVEKVLDGASCVDEICELETDHEQGDIGKISVHGKMSDSETEFSQLPRLSQSTELPRLKHPRASGLGVCQPPCPGGLDIVFDELGTRDRLSPVDILELVDIWEAEKASTDGKLGAIAKNVPHVDYNGNLPKHVRTNRKIKMSVSSDAIKLNPADEMFEELPSLDEFFLGGDTDRSRCDTVAADHKITGEEKFTGELGCNSDRLFSTSNHVNVKWRESTDFRPGVHGLSGHGTGTNEIPMRSCSQSPADNDKLSVFSDSVSEDFDHLNNQCENHAPPEVIRCEESQKFYPGGFAETEFLSDVDTKDNFDSCLVRGSVDRSCGRDYKSSLNDKVCAGKKEMLVFQNCQGEKPSSYKVSAPGTSAHMSEVAVSHDTLQRKGVKEGTAEELAYEFKSPISSSVHRERKDNSFSKRKAIVSPVTNFQEAFNVSCSLFDEDFASDSSIHDANAIIHSDAHDKPFACYEDEAAFGTADVGKRNRDDEFITEASFGETKCPVVAVTTNQRANITASLLDEDDDDDDQLLAAMCVAASMQASESLCHQEVAAENINSTVSSELIRCNTKVTESKYVGPANPENTQVTFTQAVDSVLGSSESPEDFDTCAIQLDEPLSRSHQIDHCAKNTTHSLSDSVVHDASVKITNNISSLSSQTTNQQGRNFQENDGPCSPNLSSDELSPSILTNKTRRENVSNHRNSSTPILIKRKICFEDEAGDGVQEAVYDSYNKDADLLRDEIEPQVDGKDTQRSCGFTYSPPRTDLQTSGNPRSQVKMKNRAVFDNSLGHLTPVLPVPKRKKARLILSESSSDEDFEVNVKSKKKDATTSLSTTKKSVKRKKHQAAATAFIEVEAVLSDESVDSGDEDEDDLDCYDASFVNDDTHMSQSVAQDSFDVQAMYMRSTTNSDFPAALGRFKLQFDRKIEMDVFSQVPEEEESCYSEMDSFINDDLDEDCGVESAAEITICDNKGKKSASVIKPNTRTTCVAKRRKRIRILDSSGSDEHILSPEPPAKCLGTNTGHSDNLRMLAPAASGHLNTVTEKRSGILTSSVQGNLGSPKVLAPCALGKSVHGYLSSDASGHARTSIPSGMVSSRAVVPIAKGSRTPRTTVSSTSGNCGFSVPVSASGKPKFSLPTTSGNDATSRNFRTSAPSATDTPRSSTLGCLGKPRISEPQNSAVIGSSVEDTGSTSSNCTDVKSVRSFNFKKTANSSRISTPLAQAAGLVTPDVYLLDINANDDFVFGDCEPCPKGQVTTTHNANLPPRFSTKSSEKIAPNAKIHPSYSSEPTNKIASNASHISTHVKQVTKATNMSSVPNNASVQDQLHTEPLRRQDKFEKSQSWKAENKEQREKLNEIRCKGISDVKDTSSCTEGKGMSNSQVIVIPASSSSLCGQFQSSQSDDKSKLMILIDSRELSGAQELMSTLRLMHKQNAVVCQLSGCNYAVSSRMGVERKTISDFVNGAKKSKLVDRIRHLCDLYDRPVLIIEKDRIKPGELPSKKTFFRSKYVENMLASLSQSHIKVLYSESQEETANLLSKLCLQESKKNMSVSKSPTWANHANEQVMKFYLSMPNMNYPVALNLFHNYKTIAAFLHSPVELMQTKGCMSKARAMELHRFIRHEFDSQMLPNTTDK